MCVRADQSSPALNFQIQLPAATAGHPAQWQMHVPLLNTSTVDRKLHWRGTSGNIHLSHAVTYRDRWGQIMQG